MCYRYRSYSTLLFLSLYMLYICVRVSINNIYRNIYNAYKNILTSMNGYLWLYTFICVYITHSPHIYVTPPSWLWRDSNYTFHTAVKPWWGNKSPVTGGYRKNLNTSGSTWAAFAAILEQHPTQTASRHFCPPGARGRGQARIQMPHGGHGAVSPPPALKSHLLISCLSLTLIFTCNLSKMLVL